MENFYQKLSKIGDNSNKQININDSIENFDQFNVQSSEVLADILKENATETPEDINNPRSVQEGNPPDQAELANSDDSDEEKPTDDGADASLDANGDAANEGDNSEDEAKYQLNKNEFATEFGMKKLVSIYIDLCVSIEKTIEKLRPNSEVKETLIELEELLEIVKDEKTLIPVQNIFETHSKYYLFVDRYEKLLKKIGITPDFSKIKKPK